MTKREINLFEAPLNLCYCVPNGMSLCGPCRERAAKLRHVETFIQRLNLQIPDYTHLSLTEDDPCPECKGEMKINHYVESCTCFQCAPCSYCCEQRLLCTSCGLEIDYESA